MSGEWHFKVRPSTSCLGEFLAWCARTPDLGNGPLDVLLTSDVYFEFGRTPEEAIAKLKKEVLN